LRSFYLFRKNIKIFGISAPCRGGLGLLDMKTGNIFRTLIGEKALVIFLKIKYTIFFFGTFTCIYLQLIHRWLFWAKRDIFFKFVMKTVRTTKLWNLCRLCPNLRNDLRNVAKNFIIYIFSINIKVTFGQNTIAN